MSSSGKDFQGRLCVKRPQIFLEGGISNPIYRSQPHTDSHGSDGTGAGSETSSIRKIQFSCHKYLSVFNVECP